MKPNSVCWAHALDSNASVSQRAHTYVHASSAASAPTTISVAMSQWPKRISNTLMHAHACMHPHTCAHVCMLPNTRINMHASSPATPPTSSRRYPHHTRQPICRTNPTTCIVAIMARPAQACARLKVLLPKQEQALSLPGRCSPPSHSLAAMLGRCSPPYQSLAAMPGRCSPPSHSLAAMPGSRAPAPA